MGNKFVIFFCKAFRLQKICFIKLFTRNQKKQTKIITLRIFKFCHFQILFSLCHLGCIFQTQNTQGASYGVLKSSACSIVLLRASVGVGLELEVGEKPRQKTAFSATGLYFWLLDTLKVIIRLDLAKDSATQRKKEMLQNIPSKLMCYQWIAEIQNGCFLAKGFYSFFFFLISNKNVSRLSEFF